MPPDNPDPPSPTALVRTQVRSIQEPSRSSSQRNRRLVSKATPPLTGWQIVVMFAVAIAGLTIMSAVVDATAIAVLSTAVTSLATGVFIGRQS